jgi:excisionase family DNA binding protein
MTFTIKEVAADLRVTESTVYKLIQTGRLKAFKIGNRLRIKELDLDKFKEEGIETLRANQSTD